MEIPCKSTSFFNDHIQELIGRNSLNVLTCITDRCSKNLTGRLQQIHSMQYFFIHTCASSKIINFLKSFQTDRKRQIADFFHLLAKCFINQCSIRKCMECAIIMFLTQLYNVIFSDKRFSASIHIEVNSELFSLCNNTVQVIVCKIQPISIFCRPAAGTMQITGTGRIHKNQPRDITVIFLTHFTDCLCSVKCCLISQIQCSLTNDIWIQFINHVVDIFYPFIIWILNHLTCSLITFFLEIVSHIFFCQIYQFQKAFFTIFLHMF